MLKERAKVYYYDEGKNCAEAILLAGGDCYDLKFTEKDDLLFKGFGGGMGCGGICGCLAGSIGVLGQLFGKKEGFRDLCAEFVGRFNDELKCDSTDCRDISAKYKNEEVRCLEAVEIAGDLLEAFVAEKNK